MSLAPAALVGEELERRKLAALVLVDAAATTTAPDQLAAETLRRGLAERLAQRDEMETERARVPATARLVMALDDCARLKRRRGGYGLSPAGAGMPPPLAAPAPLVQ